MDENKIPYREHKLYPLFIACVNGKFFFYFIDSNNNFCRINCYKPIYETNDVISDIEIINESIIIIAYNYNIERNFMEWINPLLMDNGTAEVDTGNS